MRRREEEKPMKADEIKPEDARASHYTKVAAWFTFAQQPRYARHFGHMAALHYGVAARHVSPVMSLRSVRRFYNRRGTSQSGKRCKQYANQNEIIGARKKTHNYPVSKAHQFLPHRTAII